MNYQMTEPFGAKPAGVSYVNFLLGVNARTNTDVFIDVYTGRTMSHGSSGKTSSASHATETDRTVPLSRRNPITGAEEAREYLKSHGCDLAGADYGNLITLRSGTGAFYDKRLESGLVNISGLRAGCRNSII